jgi:hypothetical protein
MISAGILEMCVFMCLNLDMLGAPQHNFLRSKALIRASGVDMVLLIRILVVRLAVWVEVGPEKQRQSPPAQLSSGGSRLWWDEWMLLVCNESPVVPLGRRVC